MKTIFTALFALILLTQSAKSEELAGKIWDVRNNSFVTFQEMLTDVQDAEYLLLGERHGRVAHQSRAAFLIGAMVESGHYPDVAFEMLTTDQTGIVQSYRAKAPEYALGLALELSWADTNWPDWHFYLPIFEMVFTAKLGVWGADLPNSASIDANIPMPADSLAYYQDSMVTAHCGLIDDARSLELATLQVARDRSMASVLEIALDAAGSAVLIAGSSHIRRDTGIPSILQSESIRTVALRETDEATDVMTDSSAFGADHGFDQFDYVWFTPKVEGKSLCDKI